MQRNLGEQVNVLASKDLVARVQELTVANQQLAAAVAQAEADRNGLMAELAESQDDLTAARTALRNMMRDQNRDAPQ